MSIQEAIAEAERLEGCYRELIADLRATLDRMDELGGKTSGETVQYTAETSLVEISRLRDVILPEHEIDRETTCRRAGVDSVCFTGTGAAWLAFKVSPSGKSIEMNGAGVKGEQLSASYSPNQISTAEYLTSVVESVLDLNSGPHR